MKYIDPTYMIRACRANASDRILCAVLGQNAVCLGLTVITFILLLSNYQIESMFRYYVLLICRNNKFSRSLASFAPFVYQILTRFLSPIHYEFSENETLHEIVYNLGSLILLSCWLEFRYMQVLLDLLVSRLD